MAQLDGQRQPGGVRHLGSDRGRGAHHVGAAQAKVAGHLPAARGGLALFAKQAQVKLARGEAQAQHQGQVAVVRHDIIIATPQGEGGASLDAFLPHGGDVEGNLALPVQGPGALVQPPGAQHLPIDVQQVFR